MRKLDFEVLENVNSFKEVAGKGARALGLPLATMMLFFTMNISKVGAQNYFSKVPQDFHSRYKQTHPEFDPFMDTNDGNGTGPDPDIEAEEGNGNITGGPHCVHNLKLHPILYNKHRRFKQSSASERTNYCPQVKFFATPDAITQAGGNMGTRVNQTLSALSTHDDQAYIDHNYTFSANSGNVIDVSTLTMSELNSQGNNNVWFNGIDQSELLYNLTVYQYDTDYTLGLATCFMASTEAGNPEMANYIEDENLIGDPGAVYIAKFTGGGGFDALRNVHGVHAHIRGAKHTDNPSDTSHALASADNFATAAPVNQTWKGPGGSYNTTVNSVNTNGSPNINPCAPLALNITHFSGENIGTSNFLYLQAENDGKTKELVLQRSSNGVDRRDLPYASIDYSNKPSGPISETLEDEHPLIGDNYYRVKVIDKDNAYKISEIRKVRFGKNTDKPAKENSDYFVYPNPTPGHLTIDLKNNAGGYTSGWLSDIHGRSITSIQIPEGSYEGILDLSQLPNGIYFVRLLDSNGNRNVKKIQKS